MLVVIEIVGTHDGPHIALGHGCVEGGEINLVQGAVTDLHIHLIAIFLAVVECIVLDTGRDVV